MLLLCVFLVSVAGGYRLSIRYGARKLAADNSTSFFLWGGQWTCIALSCILIGVSVTNDWAIYSVDLVGRAFLGSGWLAGVRARLGLCSSWGAPLARTFSWLMLILFPILLIWLAWTSPPEGDEVYGGSTLRIVIAAHFSLRMDAEEYQEVILIKRESLFWEQQVGTLTTNAPSLDPSWWADVSAVHLNRTQQTVLIHKARQQPVTIEYFTR